MSEELPKPMPPPREDSGLPGGRAALPSGKLSKPFFSPQGDEHRDPPENAPSPVKPAPQVVVEHPAPKRP